MKHYILIALFLVLGSTSVSGQTGIRTENPSSISAFHVDGAQDNPTSGDPSAVQATNDFIVNQSGHVGIGVLPGNATAIVEVNGQMRLTGTASAPAASKVLVSDANGLATWKNNAFNWTAVVYNMTATATGNMTGGSTQLAGTGGSVTATLITVPVNGIYRITGSYYSCFASGTGSANFSLLLNGVANGLLLDSDVTSTEVCFNNSRTRLVNIAAGTTIGWSRQDTGATVTNGSVEVTLVR